jgi:hypothetical protein
MTLYKVKVLRSVTGYSDIDYDGCNLLYPVSADWEEVTAERREEIRDAVNMANQMRRNDGYYFMVEYHEGTVSELFADASAFAEKIRKEKEREERRRADEKARRDSKAAERKRRQFEKLKEELGEK